MDLLATLLRAIHIGAGVIALAIFIVPLVTKKGGKVHRLVGRIYVRAMYVAAATVALITPIRMMQRPPARWGFTIFLAYVALLSFTAAFYGERVLAQKKRVAPSTSTIDLAWPSLLLLSTAGIVLYGIVVRFWLAVYFAPIGALVSVGQLRALRSAPAAKMWWLREHLVSMSVSCIATVTAFLVVGAGRLFHAVTSPVVWLAPTVIGIPCIVYFRRKYEAKGGNTDGREITREI